MNATGRSSVARRVLRLLGSKTLAVLTVAVLLGALLVTVAYAAISSRQVLSEGSNLSYRFERVSSDSAGFDSGWHIHPGLVIVHIESGLVQFYQGSCSPRTFNPGDTIIEVPWKPARFVAPAAAAWTTSFIVPTGQQLSVSQRAYSPEQPNPCP